MTWSLTELLTTWAPEPMVAVPVIAAGGLYLWGAWRARRSRGWPSGRTLAFLSGLVLVVLATQSGLAARDELFAVHAVQHLLLGMAAPPLLALGAPLTLVRRAVPTAGRRLTRVARSPLALLAVNPFLGWVLFVSVPFVLYFSPLYRLSLASDVVHHGAHVLLLGTAMLFFWPLLGGDRLSRPVAPGARVLSLALTLPFHAFLGVALASSSSPRLSPTGGLADQRLGGTIMWLAGDLLVVVLMASAVLRWMADEERRAVREDALVDSAAGT